MIFNKPPTPTALSAAYRMDETVAVNNLLKDLKFSKNVKETAQELVIKTRERLKNAGPINSFLNQYDLSSEEGIALMCMAEALLRVPDSETIDRLISDKISTAEWEKHAGTKNSFFLNAATWSLFLTGKIYAPKLNYEDSLGSSLKRVGSRLGSAVIRPIVLQGMKLIGDHFVMGQTIEAAIKRAEKNEALGYRYSYDMLGESAKTEEDAINYFNSYQHAISQLSKNLGPIKGPGISVKLSALHPRYEVAKRERVLKELTPRLLVLAQMAKKNNIGLTVDAEEADRLELSLEIIEAVFSDPSLNDWEGFGLAVQAYQKRAPLVIDWLADLSKRYKKKLMVRLVKGAYWDSEIKQSQLLGLEGYPVFTRKKSTDVSYLACAKKLIAEPNCFYPQFGTHNAYTIAAILDMIGTRKDFEFQCLHSMGEALYDQIIDQYPCRIYAPVGHYKDLLGYLVRRLLENGANTSFINLIADDATPVEKLIEDPVEAVAKLDTKPHPHIPLPKDLYSPRKNSEGLDLSNYQTLTTLKIAMENTDKALIKPILDSTLPEVEAALAAQTPWDASIDKRALILERIADLFQENMPQLMNVLCLEGNKQIVDCVSEVREAIDFCRYYAERARIDLTPQTLPGPTGELNQLSLHPRGIVICISPWNFPLAIFTGQVVAALVCGNSVIAKPAEQTPAIAKFAVDLMHQAGVPKNVLHLITGRGETVGAKLTSDERIAGVMFTGSTETARIIQKTLANKPGPLAFLVAETGGQNAMIVDSSALPEQVVTDVIQSAFNSAGQRCSALRVLFIQEDIADRVINMLKGAMAEIMVGDPSQLSTDSGPVIDTESLQNLQKHFEKMSREASLIYQVPMPSLSGNYFAPCAFELKDLSLLKREVFGPFLHVIRYKLSELNQVLDSIINTGYGLTLGIHSRINANIEYIVNRMPVGNCYVNRNIIGAVVGVQPFGGERLSGTGPKAGGPHYLPRLCVERCISINTTAAGGNATLLTLQED